MSGRYVRLDMLAAFWRGDAVDRQVLLLVVCPDDQPRSQLSPRAASASRCGELTPRDCCLDFKSSHCKSSVRNTYPEHYSFIHLMITS